MKGAYPVIINKKNFTVYCPDFDIRTEGTSIEDCIEMAREAIGLSGISLEDIGKPIPEPSYDSPKSKEDEIVTFIDVDFAYFRSLEDNRMVKRNCTIPNYLNVMGERAGFNFSEILRTGLMERLNLK